MQYHIRQGGKKLPGCTLLDLRGMQMEGKILPDAEYWHEGMPEWRSVDELLPGITPAAPVSGRKLLTPPVARRERVTGLRDDAGGVVSRLSRVMMRMLWVFSCITFFLPMISVVVPIFGPVEASMFDLLMSGGEKSGAGAADKPTLPDLIDMPESGLDGSSMGILVCALAGLGLAGHYFFSIVWGITEFVTGTPTRRLDGFWLLLGAQFPILILIGGKMVISGVVQGMASELKKSDNPFEGLGMMLMNNVSISPGAAMWGLTAGATGLWVLNATMREPQP
jgi:hypothetical protein